MTASTRPALALVRMNTLLWSLPAALLLVGLGTFVLRRAVLLYAEWKVASILRPHLLQQRARSPLQPEGEFLVEITPSHLRCTAPDGTLQMLAWSDLNQIDVLSTADGPLSPDTFWLLHGSAAGCVIPWGTRGDQKLLAHLQTLHGFDHHAVINSTGHTEEMITTCWRRC